MQKIQACRRWKKRLLPPFQRDSSPLREIFSLPSRYGNNYFKQAAKIATIVP
ncbi:hypothetical protein [Metarhizobium album]|uniref:hypothetical protein n=1 Tax=Metarhizobium album TaxID=2182425 RepID=UPI001402A0EA|nr:hypothetical protein [Rhizobium album]